MPVVTCAPAGMQADEASRVRGHQGNHRLHHKWEQFETRHKRRVIANVAIARELAGWCWSLAAPRPKGTPIERGQD